MEELLKSRKILWLLTLVLAVSVNVSCEDSQQNNRPRRSISELARLIFGGSIFSPYDYYPLIQYGYAPPPPPPPPHQIPQLIPINFEHLPLNTSTQIIDDATTTIGNNSTSTPLSFDPLQPTPASAGGSPAAIYPQSQEFSFSQQPLGGAGGVSPLPPISVADSQLEATTNDQQDHHNNHQQLYVPVEVATGEFGPFVSLPPNVYDNHHGALKYHPVPPLVPVTSDNNGKGNHFENSESINGDPPPSSSNEPHEDNQINQVQQVNGHFTGQQQQQQTTPSSPNNNNDDGGEKFVMSHYDNGRASNMPQGEYRMAGFGMMGHPKIAMTPPIPPKSRDDFYGQDGDGLMGMLSSYMRALMPISRVNTYFE